MTERYEQYHGIHVLRLEGDDYEMGYQHGAALRDAVARGPVPHFERYVERMLSAGVGRAAGGALAAVLGRTVGRRIAAGFPAHAMAALNGLADGAALDRRRLLRAVSMPESYLWVLRCVMALRGPDLAPRHGVPLMGCTSAVAWGDATADGALLHGRNFDYQGVGSWDVEPAVVFHRPTGGQPFVSVSAAGILFGGITAMNASGLSLVVHQHMASEALSLGNTPIGVAGDQVMRHARDLDDARRILDADTPNGCWTYVIASAREQAVLCYEVTPKARSCFLAHDETFGYANIFLDRGLARTERHLYPSHWRNNAARHRRANAALERMRGAIDADAIASILGDPGDPGCRFSEAISQLMTVASVVFRPGEGILYMATGRAPTSNRPFVAFDLNARAPRSDLPALEGGVLDDAASVEAFDAYRDGYEAYFDHGDVKTARRYLDRAGALQPRQPLYWFIGGLLALHDGDAAAAERAMDRALELGHADPERVAAFHLWRGRARDIDGRRRAAIDDYRAVGRADDAVLQAAKRGLRRPWRRRRFGIEFALADVPVP